MKAVFNPEEILKTKSTESQLKMCAINTQLLGLGLKQQKRYLESIQIIGDKTIPKSAAIRKWAWKNIKRYHEK